MLYMNDVKCFVPESCLDIDEIGEKLNLQKSYIDVYKKVYGIEKIPTAFGISWIDFIKRPVEEIIIKNNIKKNTVRYLIHCHTAKVIAPFGDSIIRQVKNELGLDHAIAFGTSINNCASAIATMDILSHILADSAMSQAIIICGDYAFTDTLRFIPNTAILGDASAAILLNKSGSKNKLMATAIKIAGEYAKGIWLSLDEAKLFETEYPNLLASIILEAIHKSGLDKDQIKLIVPHNVNILSWKKVAKILEIPLEKIFLENVRKYSHCFGADIFINYASIEKNNLLQSGDYYVLATVGLGAVFSAAVLRY